MENILAITFDENQNAYEALTKLKELDDQEQIGLSGAAVVERKDDGSIDIKDEVGDVGWEGTATAGSSACSSESSAVRSGYCWVVPPAFCTDHFSTWPMRTRPSPS